MRKNETRTHDQLEEPEHTYGKDYVYVFHRPTVCLYFVIVGWHKMTVQLQFICKK